MKLAELLPAEDAQVSALHVIAVASAPDRFLGNIGNNTFTARRAEGFVDVVSVDDVIQLSPSETGVYEATAILGTRPNADTEFTTYDLPWDYQQIGWDGGMGSTFYTGVNVLPAALIMGDFGQDVVYGHSAGVAQATTAYWGHSGRWAYPGLGIEPARKLSILLAQPSPRDLELTLLAAHYPDEAHTVVDVPLTPALDYYGPDTPNVVDLPSEWIDAFADGSAGAIRFGPASADPGLTRVVVGTSRSLSLHT